MDNLKNELITFISSLLEMRNSEAESAEFIDVLSQSTNKMTIPVLKFQSSHHFTLASSCLR
jgi:uncharacterized membrane protein